MSKRPARALTWALHAVLAAGQAATVWPPAASGHCSSASDCQQCLQSACAAESAACAEDRDCAASAACVDSILAKPHVANTPVDCQSLECVLPCFPPAPAPPSQAFGACAASCLPATVVAGAEPQQIHIAYAGRDSDSMAVSWTTAAPTGRSSVRYGESASAGGGGELIAEGEITGYTFATTKRFGAYSQGLYKSGEIHHTVLHSLKPSTTYWYTCGGPNVWSPRRNFTTAPPVGLASLPCEYSNSLPSRGRSRSHADVAANRRHRPDRGPRPDERLGDQHAALLGGSRAGQCFARRGSVVRRFAHGEMG